MSGLPLRIVVGLGNPGPEYAATRHNAGFWFVDEIARRHGARLKHERRYSADCGRASVEGVDLWLLKPMTYMNRSGQAIRALCDYLHVPSAEVLVAHDELDLPAGTVRLKHGGGAGGHNGLQDPITHPGEALWGPPPGIRHPGPGAEDVIGYVLRRASVEDELAINDAVALAADEFPRLLTQGAEKVMNRLHTQALRPAEQGGRG